jgi:hypothetical protein
MTTQPVAFRQTLPILLKKRVLPGRRSFDSPRSAAGSSHSTTALMTMPALPPHFGAKRFRCCRVALVAALSLAGGARAEPAVRFVQAKRPPTASLNIADAVSNQTAVEPVVLSAATEPAENRTPDGAPAANPLPANPPFSAAEEVAVQEQKSPRMLRSFRPITQVTANAALPPGLLPEEAEPQEGQPQPEQTPDVGDMRFEGGWAESNYLWSATRLCHGPLYFEEINLERHGYQCNPFLQPLVSGAHFFLTVPTLPYQVVAHPPCECIYTLGYYRPGDCVPWRRQCPYPWDPRAAAVEAATAVGLVFLIP